MTDPDPGLVERLFASTSDKYGVGSRDVEGSYVVRPRVAFTWSAGSSSTYTVQRTTGTPASTKRLSGCSS